MDKCVVKIGDSSIGRCIRVVFIVSSGECWDKVEPVYEEMNRRGDFETIILITPNQFNTDVAKSYNELLKYFSTQYPRVVGWISDDGMEMNLQKLSPDYVFYPKPYPQSTPKKISPEYVIRYSKPCYVPYALTGSAYWENVPLQYERFFKSMYFYFTDTFNEKMIFRKAVSYEKAQESGLLNVEYFGYPVLEQILKKNTDMGCAKKTITGRSVLWTPRWGYGKPHGGSHFLEYRETILRLQEVYPQEEFIIRPHPDMTNELIYRRRFITQQEYDDYCSRAVCVGIKFDENTSVTKTISETKLLITDYSSIMIEFFLAGIPIIYCDSSDVELNPLFREIVDSNYVVNDEKSLVGAVEDILRNGDYKYGQRRELIEKIQKEHCGATERIVDTIVEDYDKTGRHKKSSMVAEEKLSAIIESLNDEYQQMPTRGGQIAAILKKAHNHVAKLGDDKRISPKALSQGWLKRFVMLAECVDNEYLQNLWAKLLVEEIIMPGSISMRTLSVWGNMSREETEKFIKLSKYMINNEWLIDDLEVNANFGISYEKDILDMDSMGVLQAFANLSFNAVATANLAILFRAEKYAVLHKNRPELGDRRVSFKYYPLTKAGKELANAIGLPMDDVYFINVARRIKEINGEALVSLHNITEDFGGGVFFDKISLI